MIEMRSILKEDYLGFYVALDSVSKERRYLGTLEVPPLERIRAFVESNVDGGLPQSVAVAEGRQRSIVSTRADN
jgi:hypothetical protein